MAANGETDDYAGIEAETSFEVQLYIYDLSKGLEKCLSQQLKGKPLPGIWHTGLVAYGREYYFVSTGVESCRPGATILGEPDQILTLGKTELPYSVYLEYIFALGEAAYRPGSYAFTEHNCNTFTQEVATFLTGKTIPEEFHTLPSDVVNSPLSEILKDYFNKLCLKAEGSKGLSFGNLIINPNDPQFLEPVPIPAVNGTEATTNGSASNSPPKESKTTNNNNKMADTAQANNVEAKASSNGEVHKPESTAEPKKSSPEKSKAENSSSMPQVNGSSENTTKVNGKSKSKGKDKSKSKNSSEKSADQSSKSTASNESTVITEQKPSESSETGEPEAAAAGTRRKGSNSSRKSSAASSTEDGAAVVAANATVTSGNGENASEEGASAPAYVSRRQKRYRDPPIVYTNVDGVALMKTLTECVQERLNDEERQAMNDIQEYLISEEGAWALGTPHLDIIGRLLNDRNFPSEIPVMTLELLQALSLKEDVILLLHQDRKDHHLMSFLYRIENLPHEEQEGIVKLVCNLCYHPSSFDWLMYISEWSEEGKPCNNSKVTVRVAVHSILCDQQSMQEKGAALMFNLALKELFDDTATELATAVLQYLHGDIKEELSFLCLTSLLRFLYISYNDVPALIKMLGPDITKFSGQSERVDQLVEQIQFKLAVNISA